MLSSDVVLPSDVVISVSELRFRFPVVATESLNKDTFREMAALLSSRSASTAAILPSHSAVADGVSVAGALSVGPRRGIGRRVSVAGRVFAAGTLSAG